MINEFHNIPIVFNQRLDREGLLNSEISEKIKKINVELQRDEKSSSLNLKEKEIKVNQDPFPATEEELISSFSPDELENYLKMKNENPHFFRTVKSLLKEFSTLSHFKNILEKSKTVEEFFLNLKLSEGALDLLSVPEDEIGEKWNHYVVRREGFEKLYRSDLEGQKIYGRMMHHSIKLGAIGLQRGWSFNELLEFLAWRRALIAQTLKAPSYENVGVLRNFGQNPRTKMFGFYGSIPKKFEEKFKDVQEKTTRPKEPKEGETWVEDLSQTIKGITSLTFIGKALLEGEEIELSTISPMGFYHIDNRADFNKIMDHVEKLFKQILNTENKEEITQIAGKIFWWICQAKPWNLGDPSIAETLIRSIFAFNGMENYAWRKGLIPWVVAMREPDVNQFGKNFSALFEIPRKK